MIAELKRELEAADSVALVCHVSPDMDTLGSAVALRLLLEGMGKRAVVYAQDGVPGRFLFLSGMRDVRLPDEAVYDLWMYPIRSAWERRKRCLTTRGAPQ